MQNSEEHILKTLLRFSHPVSCYRSGVRLKSMSSGHQELNMVISQLRDVKSTAKAFATAQNTASQDMLKWSSSEENLAIQDTFLQLTELNALWTAVQKDFSGEIFTECREMIGQTSGLSFGSHFGRNKFYKLYKFHAISE